MSLGEVDTLNLLSDKLNNLFDESQDYYESFLDANNMYKQGKLTDKEFFQKLGDYVVAYSALEFLSIKVIFELKKSIDKLSGDYDGKIKFVKVNVDEANALASKYNVFSIPTLMIFNKGEIITQQVGAASKETYKNMIDKAIENL